MMTELINKHSIKIQLGVAVGVIISMLYFTYCVASYINENTLSMSEVGILREQVAKIPVLETNIATIKTDLADIKSDIKLLLRK